MKKFFFVYNFLFLIFFPSLFWRGIGGEVFAQQDAHFSQYMFNPLLLNPAYAGSREALAVALTARKQWVDIDGAPQTSSLTMQAPLRKKKVGLGFELVNDEIGPKSIIGGLFSYSYRIRLLKGKLSFGLRGGIYDYRIRWDEIKYRDKTEVYIGSQERRAAFTVDYGMYYYTKSFYWGLAATHLNRGRYAYYSESLSSSLVPHVFMTIGKGFQLGENIVFSPSMMTKGVKGVPDDVDLNLNFLIDEKIWIGMSVRSKYGLVFLAEWNVSEKFRIGYSYDLGLNKIGVLGKGSHEIHIGYDFNIFNTKTVSPLFLYNIFEEGK